MKTVSPWLQRAPLSGIDGVYVVEFPDYVKIGKAGNLRVRLRMHALKGARRITAFPILSNGRDIERGALHAAATFGRRLGQSERFEDLSFEQACALVRCGVRASHGEETLPEIVVNLDDLLVPTHPRSLRQLEIDAARLAEERETAS